MGGFLLHQNAAVQCMHIGQAKPGTPNPRVKVSGQKIVTQMAIYSVSGCGLAATTSPPCATAQFTIAATRVRASGSPVLLQDSQATCVPTGTGLKVISTQIRVRGV
jgi:hypothetical protein